jgi:hypothetical protein
VRDNPIDFLAHLSRITANVALPGEDQEADDDEISYDEDQFERGYNYGDDYQRIE